ncbi:dihydrodipicolinate synthase family protein [Thalassobaculum sp. OXR-137]|uniref:dihydrodipicolinate synthase family protein n=1 Tax=Thalassobaculum sp. OXR-137 TaxID=3100173 RepID=UPI002AC9E470|nr:dihydrodipicolinate synthase family protein [Thalassobaculum sp. OXR-137]WPZ36972.1 dihydrodipicolinate synthase family protein [Thalassobaculum sp. OXR-137]
MADPQPQGPFRGIYPMLYALFATDGALDRGANDAQVEACIAGGVHGLAVGGLASECNKLTVEERRDHARWTLEAAAGRVPVSITISDNTVGGQIDSVKRAADAGAAWAVLQPPPVKSASEEELIRFFGAVADASPIPIGIQNAPEYIGIGLSNAGLIALNRRHPTVSILKAEGTGLYIGRLAEESGGGFTLFNGRDGIEMLDSLRHGCAGLIPGVEACDVESRIYDLHMAGRAAEADRAFRQILPLLHFLMHTIDHLLCYGKRLAARRIGLSEVHDRGPALAPHTVGMAILDHWSRDLGRLGQ